MLPVLREEYADVLPGKVAPAKKALRKMRQLSAVFSPKAASNNSLE